MHKGSGYGTVCAHREHCCGGRNAENLPTCVPPRPGARCSRTRLRACVPAACMRTRACQYRRSITVRPVASTVDGVFTLHSLTRKNDPSRRDPQLAEALYCSEAAAIMCALWIWCGEWGSEDARTSLLGRPWMANARTGTLSSAAPCPCDACRQVVSRARAAR